MDKWLKLKSKVMYMLEQYEQSGQNADGSMKDPWDFLFLSTGDGKKGRSVLEIVYGFLLASADLIFCATSGQLSRTRSCSLETSSSSMGLKWMGSTAHHLSSR